MTAATIVDYATAFTCQVTNKNLYYKMYLKVLFPACHMLRNYRNLIGLEQWYFSVIRNPYVGINVSVETIDDFAPLVSRQKMVGNF